MRWKWQWEAVGVLDWDVQLQGFDLLDEIFLVVDHTSRTHEFAGFDSLFARCCRHNCRKVEDVAGKLNRSAADSSAAVDLIASQSVLQRPHRSIRDRSKGNDERSVSRHSHPALSQADHGETGRLFQRSSQS